MLSWPKTQLKAVLSASQFDRELLDFLLSISKKIETALRTKRVLPLLSDYVLATLFFEPSTRTRLSFEAAMHRLNGKVISTVGVQFSSLAKGESLFDTLKMVEAYSDICVIRHSTEGASAVAAKNISIPVINAGDGAGEHPTQALLDLYTIAKHKNLQDDFTVAFIGDIRYGRTIHSLIQLLWHYPAKLLFISPPELALPEKYKSLLKEKNISFVETADIREACTADVLYVTRIQEERFLDRQEYEKFKDSYIVNRQFVESCKNNVIVMHPLPRLNEISTDLDSHPSAVYFEQAQNGLYTRMALLLYLTGVDFS
ncbi:MAG: aspartate carbamoyltransferase [Candidatus Hydrogenedentota bacterium]|nr:MAG: aspartate carbamoyltransferase [Candidatus Hydrogenedentota bacterium]